MSPTLLFDTSDRLWLIPAIPVLVVLFLVQRALAVPKELRHLPRVPAIPTILSFLSGEVEEARIRKLLLPFAERGEPVVLVYALGRWIVHVMDRKVRIYLPFS